MNGFSILSILWPVWTVLLGGLEITVAVMLLKDGGAGPKLMLGGAVTGLLGNLATYSVPILWNLFGNRTSLGSYYELTWPITALGATFFTIGLLLYALRRRAQATRIAELEAILQSQGRG